MATFPSLTNDFAEEVMEPTGDDPTIRSTFENGYPLRRPRFTTKIRKWTYTLRMVTEADKAALIAFERDTVNYGGASFVWIHPLSSTSQAYNVNFSAPLDFTQEIKTAVYYSVKVAVEESYPKAEVV